MQFYKSCGFIYNKPICMFSIEKCWNWECMGLKGVVGLFIAHLIEMLIYYPFCAFIFCLEITALGYRWRIVLIVVDNA